MPDGTYKAIYNPDGLLVIIEYNNLNELEQMLESIKLKNNTTDENNTTNSNSAISTDKSSNTPNNTSDHDEYESYPHDEYYYEYPREDYSGGSSEGGSSSGIGDIY